jgi:hypothetical protein
LAKAWYSWETGIKTIARVIAFTEPELEPCLALEDKIAVMRGDIVSFCLGLGLGLELELGDGAGGSGVKKALLQHHLVRL